jgi:hypothetical protein
MDKRNRLAKAREKIKETTRKGAAPCYALYVRKK